MCQQWQGKSVLVIAEMGLNDDGKRNMGVEFISIEKSDEGSIFRAHGFDNFGNRVGSGDCGNRLNDGDKGSFIIITMKHRC